MGNTSSAVKNRYNAKVYKQLSFQQKKELVDSWEKKLAEDGISKAEFLRSAIIQYLNQAGE